MINLEEMVRGAIDMHVHFGPDSNFTRRVDAMQAAVNAQELGLRAIVLKSHDYTTAPLATIISRLVPQISVFGAITLDFEIGGLNPHAVECSAKLGARVLWMPTLSSANSRSKIARHLNIELKGEGISILDAKGELHSEVKEILEIAKAYNMIIANGHISPRETFKMIDFAQKIGLSKFIISHVSEQEALEETLSIDDQKRLADRGVFLEHCLIQLLPVTGRLDPKVVVEGIRAVGAEHCIISSDLGQDAYPPPAEGMRMFMGVLLRAGLTEREVEFIAKTNPAKLLELS